MTATTQCLKRLQRELLDLRKEGPSNIDANPDERDMLKWYFVVDGPADTPYAGGEYIGRIKFPPNYPFAPPAIFMLTPSGRFATETRLCLSMSDFHPESWSPAWNISTIIRGLLSFMVEDAQTYGSIRTDDKTKKQLAEASAAANLKMPQYASLFPQRAAAAAERQAAAARASQLAKAEAQRGASSPSSGPLGPNGLAVPTAGGAISACLRRLQALLADVKQATPIACLVGLISVVVYLNAY